MFGSCPLPELSPPVYGPFVRPSKSRAPVRINPFLPLVTTGGGTAFTAFPNSYAFPRNKGLHFFLSGVYWGEGFQPGLPGFGNDNSTSFYLFTFFVCGRCRHLSREFETNFKASQPVTLSGGTRAPCFVKLISPLAARRKSNAITVSPTFRLVDIKLQSTRHPS